MSIENKKGLRTGLNVGSEDSLSIDNFLNFLLFTFVPKIAIAIIGTIRKREVK